MAFKFVVLSALLAVASAGVLQPVTYAHVANPAVDAVASSHQNVVRTFDGTVSQYSKTIQTPYSSVHKSDTRVSNNVYQPAVAKTVYAAPAPAAVYTHAAPVAKTVTYAAPAPAAALYTHATPVVAKSVYAPAQPHALVAAPAVAKTVTYAAPAPVYHHEVPVAKAVSYAAPAPVYHQAAPVAIHYSPAETASHMSFDGFGTHWDSEMAFKFALTFAAFLAVANAGAILSHVAVAPVAVAKIANPSVDAVATTHQNVVRSFAGTGSHHSKAVDTPYSSVRQSDTRINNKVYAPAIAKTVTTYAAPAVTPVVSAYTAAAAAPLVSKTILSPVAKVAPVVYSHAAPVATYGHVAAAPAIAYSPAAAVAHVAFDGFGTHWGY
ncbi:pupal cuticle protein G1A-like [Bactrocera tryoni]|uniref:pupal cuticle protein G1A-like n=1 Tax=Bactrocera tryoni TaxID=59916 RepID=UPI001A9884A4|nr:pupal cuticle protein G1A-like [Bactrocera tryoni]